MDKYNEFVIRINDEVYYYIPYSEIKTDDLNYVKYVTYSKFNDGILVHNSQFKVKLRKLCNLTPQDYFDRFILEISDINDRPKCSNCGSDIMWSNRITSGYGSGGHKWNESPYHFCCNKCILEFRSKYPENYSKLSKFLKDGGGYGKLHKNPELYGLSGLNNPEIYHKTQMNKFINSGLLTDTCIFYIARTSDKIKFGIATDLDTRFAFGASFNDYKSIEKVFESDRKTVAKLEYEVKKSLGFPVTEYIDPSRYDELLNIIKSSTTISKESTLKRVEKPSID